VKIQLRHDHLCFHELILQWRADLKQSTDQKPAGLFLLRR
jgi:hypothetical protein